MEPNAHKAKGVETTHSYTTKPEVDVGGISVVSDVNPTTPKLTKTTEDAADLFASFAPYVMGGLCVIIVAVLTCTAVYIIWKKKAAKNRKKAQNCTPLPKPDGLKKDIVPKEIEHEPIDISMFTDKGTLHMSNGSFDTTHHYLEQEQSHNLTKTYLNPDMNTIHHIGSQIETIEPSCSAREKTSRNRSKSEAKTKDANTTFKRATEGNKKSS